MSIEDRDRASAQTTYDVPLEVEDVLLAVLGSSPSLLSACDCTKCSKPLIQ